MYQSPIEQMVSEIQTRYEDGVLKAVQSVGFNVDKDELLRALQYDRDQYTKGREDGYMQRDSEIVRCKDCKFQKVEYGWNCKRYKVCINFDLPMDDDDFCSWGERKEDEQIH